MSNARPEDQFSEWAAMEMALNGNPFNRPALRAQNNAF